MHNAFCSGDLGIRGPNSFPVLTRVFSYALCSTKQYGSVLIVPDHPFFLLGGVSEISLTQGCFSNYFGAVFFLLLPSGISEVLFPFGLDSHMMCFWSDASVCFPSAFDAGGLSALCSIKYCSMITS